MTKKIRKAVFPVGGQGTRFLPATKAVAKEMLPVVDKPLIQYAVEEAMEAGIEHFIFVTAKGKTALEDHFDHAAELERSLLEKGKVKFHESITKTLASPGSFFFTRQMDPKGLGHAVWCAKEFVGDEPFAVLLPDDLVKGEGASCLSQMIDVYEKFGGNVVAMQDVAREETRKYGILDVETDDGQIAKAKGLVEKPDPSEAPSTLSIIGRYILEPQVFAHLDKQQLGSGNEIQLTDALSACLPQTEFRGLRFKGTRYDCGSNIGFVEANIAFALDRDELHDGMADILKDFVQKLDS